MEERAARFAAAARDLAVLGWVPIELDGKKPRRNGWEKSKPAPPEFVAGKWSRYGRTANLGVHLGASQLEVIEPDTPEAHATMLELFGGRLPDVPIVQSGGRSLHLYFAANGNPSARRDGLELRAGAMQCVVPPSTHPDTGREYTCLAGHELAPPLLPVPEAVVAYFAETTTQRTSRPVEEEIAEGSRHAALLSVAGTLRRRGLGAEEIAAALQEVNARRCRPPLAASEVLRLARDVARRYEPGDPEQEHARAGARAALGERGAGRWIAASWEEPVPLVGRPQVPSFPVDALPGWLQEWSIEIAREKGASVDLAATLGLGGVAGATARHVQVSPRPGWHEPTNLYLAIALEPGQRKTPVFKQAFRPVRVLERARMQAWDEQNALVAISGAILDKRRKELISVAADTEDLDPEELRRRMDELLEGLGPTEPSPRPRLLTEDVTPEGLAGLLAEHGRIIAASDEGAAIFENLAGRYARGSTSWDVFNKAHSAADLVVDRKSSGPVIVWDPALTLAIATQPKVLRDLWGKPGAEGRGVLARPLYSLPAPVYDVGRTPAAPAPALAAYESSMRALFDDVPMLAIDEEGRPQPLTLRFSPVAESLFEVYEAELGRERFALGTSDEAEDDAAYLGWLSKLAGQTARLAACLHVAEHWTTGATVNVTIAAEHVEAAIALARYFHAHARVVFGLMGELPEQRRALVILGWLRARSDDELAQLTVRDIHRTRGKGTSADEVRTALALLEQHGYVRLERRPRAGSAGRATERVHVHPEIKTALVGPTNPTLDTHIAPTSGLSGQPRRDSFCPEHPDAGAWKARDGAWRCRECAPPALPGEVVEERA